jgi:DNA-binding CsgD family transcriptional regulator
MPHLVFVFYLLSLFSGVFLLSQLLNSSDKASRVGDRAFGAYYSLIAGFVCVSAAYLYMNINLPSPYLFNSYASIIFLFLGTLPYSMTKYHQVAFQLERPAWVSRLLFAQVGYGLVLAFLIWWLPQKWSQWFFLISISLLVCSLVINGRLVKSSALYPSRSSFAKRLSNALIIQSIGLPLAEATLFGAHLLNDGVTYSLPLVFLINNIMLWKYKQHLLLSPSSRPLMSATYDQLSPKEQEIATALSKGLSNKQIAFDMNISPSTVKNHVYNIFKKCQVTNRVELVTKLQK